MKRSLKQKVNLDIRFSQALNQAWLEEELFILTVIEYLEDLDFAHKFDKKLIRWKKRSWSNIKARSMLIYLTNLSQSLKLLSTFI